MSKFSSSSLFLLLALLRPGATTEDANCGGMFLPGNANFVLYAEDSVKEGAALLATPSFSTDAECERACCKDPRCNLVLLEPRGTAAENLTCVLLDCVHRNRFVCKFVKQDKYQSYIRLSMFEKYLGTRQKSDENMPIANAGCDVTVQPGETVTLNGTESLAKGDAKIKDYRWSLDSRNNSVEMEKTDFPDQVQLSNLQPGSYVFKLTVTDSNGQSDDAKVRVLVLNPQQTSLYCRAPAKVGPCRAAFTRWHYNATTAMCETFVFGGCKGNDNNYLSEEQCLSACRGVTVTPERSITLPTTEVCGSPCSPDQLTCDNSCCLDRSLECDNVKQCSDGSDENQCNKLNQTLSFLLDISVNQKKAQCTDPPRTGPCRANFPRWYYDPLSKKCHSFTFGGCDGNKNSFETKQECKKTCAGITESDVFARGLFERLDMEEDENSGSITLAVILSVGIMALLAILAYCFLKRRKRTHMPVNNTGTAHEALPVEETSVYNSTTKPV